MIVVIYIGVGGGGREGGLVWIYVRSCQALDMQQVR